MFRSAPRPAAPDPVVLEKLHLNTEPAYTAARLAVKVEIVVDVQKSCKHPRKTR
jgi:hypothetical protein